jgi:hypothetical protein
MLSAIGNVLPTRTSSVPIKIFVMTNDLTSVIKKVHKDGININVTEKIKSTHVNAFLLNNISKEICYN